MSNSCDDCLLNCRPVKPSGKKGARFLIVNRAISHSMAIRKENITPAALKMLAKHMKLCGFSKEDFVFTNAVQCGYDPKQWRAKDRKIIEKACRERLTEAIQKFKPEVIIPLGADATSAVQGRRVKISKVRGVAVYNEEHEAFVCPTLDPALAVRYPQNEPLFASDCKTLQRIVEHEYDIEAAENDALGNYSIVTDLQFLVDMEPEYLAFDLETLGTRWRAPDAAIMTMQFSVEEGSGWLLSWDHPEAPAGIRAKLRLKKQLQKILQNPNTSVIGQNGKYDQVWIYDKLHFRYRLDHDTIMLAALVDENLQQKNLDTLTKIHVPEMAGYADCVALDTEILTYDMRKVQAADLKVGDRLCAFTCDTDGRKAARRKMAISTVLDTQILSKQCFKIVTESGRNITVSAGHLMLSKKGNADAGGGWRWRRSDELAVGNVLKPFPWEDPLCSYEAGYVSGIIDGEGWLHKGRLRLGFAQRPGVVLETTRNIIIKEGVSIGHSTDKRKDVPVVNVTMDGRHCIEVLQKYRPKRLLENSVWEGAGLPTNGIRHDKVVSITSVGVKKVLGLKTSTQTIISNGLLSHNSFNAEYDKSRMDLVPLHKIVGYGVGDTDAVLSVFFELIDIVDKDEKLYNHYRRVSMPGINAFMRIDHRGMLVDEKALDAFEETLYKYVESLRKGLLRRVPKSIKQKHLEAGIKFSRPAFLIDILFRHKDGFKLIPKVYTETTENLKPEFQVPSTSSKDHLPFFFTHKKAGKFCIDLAEWIKTDRLLGTNVRRFRENFIIEGKVNPVYGLWVAVTGRTNSRDPNGQNFPKRGKYAKAYRKIFKAPKGYVILSADLSQAELRIAAEDSQDATMLRIYKEGGDIHKTTALIVMGVSEKEFDRMPKEERDLARFKAKACIAEGQQVLTNSGLKYIEEITVDDLVWDGIEWVQHEGVEYQGDRFTMKWCGVRATPEHIVFTEEGAMPMYLAKEAGLNIVTKCETINNHVRFFYGIIEKVEYLKGYLHETVSTRSIVEKAREYGFADIINIDEYST